MKETLIILAAGLGSRYGGMKQVDGVGSNNEPIIEFTIYDAIKAGFKKIILVINKVHQDIFEETLVKKIRPFVEVEYAYQSLYDIPDNIEVPQERTKPWGTTHALLSAKDIINDDPFVVCNADDYYGKDAFNKAIDFFHTPSLENDYCMVGYRIENTLSENGSVTRGLCIKDKNGFLAHIEEGMGITRKDNGAAYIKEGKEVFLEKGSLVSMNFWGFKPSIFNKLSLTFNNEIKKGIISNPLKYEAMLPNHIGKLIESGQCRVKVLSSNDTWFGVTYKEDRPKVVEKFKQLKQDGLFPQDLWK